MVGVYCAHSNSGLGAVALCLTPLDLFGGFSAGAFLCFLPSDLCLDLPWWCCAFAWSTSWWLGMFRGSGALRRRCFGRFSYSG